ncbi:MAG: ATPase, partial [Actinobacteria bacterium]
RLVLSFDAVAEGISAQSIVHQVVQAVPPPWVAPRGDRPVGLAAA